MMRAPFEASLCPPCIDDTVITVEDPELDDSHVAHNADEPKERHSGK